MIFQIEDIRKIDMVKNEPVIGFKYPDDDYDEYSENENIKL